MTEHARYVEIFRDQNDDYRWRVMGGNDFDELERSSEGYHPHNHQYVVELVAELHPGLEVRDLTLGS